MVWATTHSEMVALCCASLPAKVLFSKQDFRPLSKICSILNKATDSILVHTQPTYIHEGIETALYRLRRLRTIGFLYSRHTMSSVCVLSQFSYFALRPNSAQWRGSVVGPVSPCASCQAILRSQSKYHSNIKKEH